MGSQRVWHDLVIEQWQQVIPTDIFVSSCNEDICVIAEIENDDNFNII